MQVAYLSCVFEDTFSGEPMTLKALKKINGKLNNKNKFLTPILRRMVCNALSQPHSDYAGSKWHPDLNEKLKTKI